MYSDYKDLLVWKKSIELVEDIYRITRSFPEYERYALTNQINRAVVSVPSNIAEGKGRQTKKEFKHFLHLAKGSLYEVETQLIIAQKLKYIPEKDSEKVFEKIKEIEKMLTKLIVTLN